VTLVGTIREITPQSTNVSYRIEDGTGMIDAKQWVDAEQGATTSDLTYRFPLHFPHTYTLARVTGQLKSFNSKRHIGVHHIRKITDHNEVIFHLLEATSIHLFNTRGPPGGAKTGQSFSRNDTMDEIIQGTTSNSNANPALDHLEPFQRQIMLLVHNAPPTNEGLHVQTIAQNLQMPIAKVMGAVEQLTTDGLLYTTIDDDHVASFLSLAADFV
jgi:replication factor A2